MNEAAAARTKQEVIDEISRLIGTPRRLVSAGSSEPKQILVDIADALELDIDRGGSKPEIAEEIANRLGATWDESCDSRNSDSGGGSTITLTGLRRLHAALANRETRRMEQARYAADERAGETDSRAHVSHLINIRPGVSVLGVFKDMNYRTWYAIGEFVDNALQSYLDNRDSLMRADGPEYRLRVDIETDESDGGTIVLRDNAAGINSERYEHAFVTADPPPNRAGLSRYGIGMKSAACWFASNWTVRTKALGEPLERTITFDVPQIIKTQTEAILPEERPARALDHYTEVRLEALHSERQDIFSGRTIGKVKGHLTSMYRRFLRRGELTLTFNGEELAHDTPFILEHAPAWSPKAEPIEWAKPIEFEFGDGRRATGFAALLRKGRRASAGFALFQNDRLIEGSVDDAYRPSAIFGGMESFRNLRLFGELQISGVGVAHTKDKFTWSDPVEQKFLAELREHLDAPPLPLLRQADEMRVRTSEQVSRGGVENALDSAASALSALEPAVEQQSDQPAVPMAEIGEEQPRRGTELSRDLDLTVHGESWRITLELSKDPSLADWLYVGATDAGPAGVRAGGPTGVRRVLIRMALDHPFMNQWVTSWSTLEAVVRLAAGLAIAEVTARESGATMPSTVRSHLNRYLREALALPTSMLGQGDLDG